MQTRQIVQGRQGSKQRGLGRWQRCIMRRLTRGAAARSAPHPTPRYPDPYSNPSPDILITPDYHTPGWKSNLKKKTGNGVFQDLWFRVLMPSLIFGQFAAKLENKIRFGRSVGGSNMGRLAAKYRSFIPFKKKVASHHSSDWHQSTWDTLDNWKIFRARR